MTLKIEDRGEPAPEPHELSEAELNSIGYTISRYGNLTGNDLERFSHTEEPWIVSRRSHAEGESDRINNDPSPRSWSGVHSA